jgi:hypothetical protein
MDALIDPHHGVKILVQTYNKLELPDPSFYYRYDTYVTMYPRFEGQHFYEGTFTMILNRYAIRRILPKSVIIDDPNNWKTDERRIGKDWNKKFAHPSIELAQQSFLRRKKAQISLLERQLLTARSAYNCMSKVTQTPLIPFSPAPVIEVYGSLSSRMMFEDELPI